MLTFPNTFWELYNTVQNVRIAAEISTKRTNIYVNCDRYIDTLMQAWQEYLNTTSIKN